MKSNNPYQLRSKKTNIYKRLAKSIKIRRAKFQDKNNKSEDKILDANPSEKFYGVRSGYLKNKIILMKKEHREYALKIYEPKKKNLIFKILVVSLILLPIVSTISKRAKEKRLQKIVSPKIIKIYLLVENFHDKQYLIHLIKNIKDLKITNNPSNYHIMINTNKMKKPCISNNFATITSKIGSSKTIWKVFDQKTPCNKHFVSDKILNLIRKNN